MKMTTMQFMIFLVDEDIALRKLRAAIVLQCNDCTVYALHYVLARPLQDLKLYAQRWLAAEKRHGHPLISGTPICDDVHELLGLPPLPLYKTHKKSACYSAVIKTIKGVFLFLVCNVQ
jgi:hypothetical protein